jgi:hypothetical protein
VGLADEEYEFATTISPTGVEGEKERHASLSALVTELKSGNGGARLHRIQVSKHRPFARNHTH